MKTEVKAYLAIAAAACILSLTSLQTSAQLLPVIPHELLPEQKIVIESENVPPWKALWDEARTSALQGDFDKALRQYRSLLALKDDLEEARWELARIMMYKKQWAEAAQFLELLLETSPDSTVYLNALGKVMLEMEQYERAVALFQRTYQKSRSDRTALAGLVEGLIKLSRKNEALPYLEQFVWQEPTNRGIRRYLAFLLYETGNYEKARAHFTILARNEDVGLDVLLQTAKTYEQLGLKQQAATYWERIQGRNPEIVDAHRFLGRFYADNSQWNRALYHLEEMLAHDPGNMEIYAELGHIAAQAGENDKALGYYRKFLQQHPEDQEVRQGLASLTETGGRKRKSRTVAPKPSSTKDQKQLAQLEEASGKLLTEGRYRDVAALYRQLIKTFSADQEILAALARDATFIRKKYGLEAMVQFLSDAVQTDLAIYRGLADIFQSMAREDELLAVLAEIQQINPADNLTTQELAILYLNRGELDQSRKYFEKLSDTDCLNIRCLEARASYAELVNLPAHGLQYYEALLEMQPDRYGMRLKAIALAARLGLLDRALFHAGYLQNVTASGEDLALKVLLADAYRNSGYATRAVKRYQSIIDQTVEMKHPDLHKIRLRSWLGIVEAYKKLDLPYEAEQVLRLALTQEQDRFPFLLALFHLYLETGRTAQSEIWLQAILRSGEGDGQSFPEWLQYFLEAEMYAAAGDHDLAVELYRQVESREPGQLKSAAEFFFEAEISNLQLRTGLNTAISLLESDEHEEAEKTLLSLKSFDNPELQVLLEKVYREWEKPVRAEKISEQVRNYAVHDLGRQLVLAELYDKYGIVAGMAESAEEAVVSDPESLAAKYLLVDARLKQKKYTASLELLSDFLQEYPENTWFLSKQAETLARQGEFQAALAVTDMILSENRFRADIVLLRSRILWEMNRWKESVSLYESVVEPPVAEILERKIMGEQPVLVEPSHNWWKTITFSGGTTVTITEAIMPPQQAVRFSDENWNINAYAAEYYALFRWQERFSQELSVRRSVMRREYYHAANKLERLIEEYGPNDFLLYDLAGLYSKLDRLGDEAIIYRKIAAQNGDFPGLPEAVQRNSLKRRPQVSLAYRVQEDDGWDGYKAVRQKTLKGSWKYYQTTKQRWSFDIARIYYESINDSQDLDSWRSMLTYDLKLTQNLNLALGGGVERFAEIYDDTPLLYGSVTGKIADEMRAVFSVSQDVVPDTIASLKRNIKKRDYKIELLLDLFPSLLLGGHFDFINFSDSNWTNNYTFWASYILLPEPTLLKINYNYDLYDSREGSKPGPPTDDGFGSLDHPYWSPVSYWITRFSMNFKHQLSNDALARGVPSYYTIEYSLGYDSDDNDLHEMKGSFNFEIARNYTISASYGFTDLGEYRHEELLLSLMYRF